MKFDVQIYNVASLTTRPSNVRKAICEFKHGKLTTIFDVSSLFYDLFMIQFCQNDCSVSAATLRNSSHLSAATSNCPEDVKMLLESE